MDARLVQCCRLLEPTAVLSEVAVPEEIKTALPALLSAAGKEREPLRLYFRGQRGAQRRQTAEALAGMSAARMLLVDLETALASAADFATLLQLIFREACLLDALVYFEGLDALRGAERAPSFKCFSAALAESRATVIMAGTAPLGKALQDAGCAVLEVVFPRADFERRRASWQAALRRHGVKADAALTEELAGRFRLTHGEIDSAARAARARALWRQAARGSRVRQAQNGAREETADLYTAAREQSSDNLSSLASKISPRYELSDIVLPPDQLDQLTEICNRARFRHVVSGQWGFGRKSSLGNGLNALFSGPPGTGKTMAAEVIARELHLDLYKIDLSQIVSKYIGETEKNLDRIFREAQTSSSILFFDEADALFGKRSEVTDAHDRYANIEVGYLLQKMEEYDGIAILATNLRQNMDDAFLRRLHVHLEFPFPDESHRKSIWRTVFPQEAPLHAEVDFDRLAREIKLAGGNIRSIAMTAAYFAASNGGRISMSHLVRAARREFQKLGRGWTEEL
jgi:SpoVK/Ycf46/Vps4 family AAA+-type ATPase